MSEMSDQQLMDQLDLLDETLADAPQQNNDDARPRNLRNIRTLLIAAERDHCANCKARFLVLPKKRNLAETETINVLKTTQYHSELKCWYCTACLAIINTTKQTYSIALPLMPKIEFLFDIYKQIQVDYRLCKWIEVVRLLFQQDPAFPRVISTGPADKTTIDFELLLQDYDPLQDFAKYNSQLTLCTFLDNLYKEYSKTSKRSSKKPVFAFGEESDDEDNNPENDEEAARQHCGLTITAAALHKISLLVERGFFEFVDNKWQSNKSFMQFVQNSIQTNAKFLPRIVDTVISSRALAESQVKTDSDRKRLFFKRLDGHYNGKPGNCAKKAVTHIWRELRKVESFANLHEQFHGARVVDLDYNEGRSLQEMSKSMKHYAQLKTFEKNKRLAEESKSAQEQNCQLDRYFNLFMVRKEIMFQYPEIKYIDGSSQKVHNINQIVKSESYRSIVPATRPCKKQLSPYFCTTHLQPAEKIREITCSKKLNNMGPDVWLPSVYAATSNDDYSMLFMSKEQKDRKKKHARQKKKVDVRLQKAKHDRQNIKEGNKSKNNTAAGSKARSKAGSKAGSKGQIPSSPSKRAKVVEEKVSPSRSLKPLEKVTKVAKAVKVEKAAKVAKVEKAIVKAAKVEKAIAKAAKDLQKKAAAKNVKVAAKITGKISAAVKTGKTGRETKSTQPAKQAVKGQTPPKTSRKHPKTSVGSFENVEAM